MPWMLIPDILKLVNEQKNAIVDHAELNAFDY